MNIAVIGMGLIGGSLARAIKEYTSHTCIGFDSNHSVLLAATLAGAIDRIGNDDDLSQCDMIIIALYPKATVEFLQNHASSIKKGAIVVDTCGVKRSVCAPCYGIAAQNGFCFIGGHPMAGTQYSGFNHSRANMFRSATMIMCAEQTADMPTIFLAREFFLSLGFGNVHFVSPEEHDKMIAFTSQLAHVVSNAYVRSPQALNHKGFSAGSYKDLTRVAQLNADMWTELFLDNKDNLTQELDTLIEYLQKYNNALKQGNAADLRNELAIGSAIKQQAERG